MDWHCGADCAKGFLMKRILLLTTAMCGLYTVMGAAEAQANIRTTTTTVYRKDFPENSWSTSSSSYTVEDCGPSGDHNRGDDGNETCFAYDTRVLMSDGSVKKIGEIATGDETAYGTVHRTFIRRFNQAYMMTEMFQRVYRGGLYDYRGILATGNHVLRDGVRWMALADTPEARPVSVDAAAHIGNVYNLDVEGGIIPIVNPDGELISFLDDKQALIMERIAV